MIKSCMKPYLVVGAKLLELYNTLLPRDPNSWNARNQRHLTSARLWAPGYALGVVPLDLAGPSKEPFREYAALQGFVGGSTWHPLPCSVWSSQPALHLGTLGCYVTRQAPATLEQGKQMPQKTSLLMNTIDYPKPSFCRFLSIKLCIEKF